MVAFFLYPNFRKETAVPKIIFTYRYMLDAQWPGLKIMCATADFLLQPTIRFDAAKNVLA